MKTTIITLSLLLFSIVGQTQNKNVKEETKTTTTTVKNSDGVKKYVKKENTKEVQNIELQNAKANTLNIDTKESPVNVTTTTRITNPDGSTRTVDVDRSSYYLSNGTRYKLALDAYGYTMSNGNDKPYLLRRTTTNTYMFRSSDKTAISYFDTNGDLVVETYNDKTDTITVDKYTVIKE